MGNAAAILVPQLAKLYLAPVGSLAPTDLVTFDAAWREVGLFTQDSLKFSADANFEVARSHQSDYETRTWQTTASADVEVDLQEWNGANFRAVYGGGTLASLGAGVYKFTPPRVGGRTEIAAFLHIQDGTKLYRRMIPRCQQTAGVEQGFDKTKESILPLRLKVLGSDSADPWYDISNDALFAPGAVTIGTLTPATGARSATVTGVAFTGTGFVSGLAITFSGTGVSASNINVTSATALTCDITATAAAAATARDVIVTNPDGGTATKTGGWTVT